MHEKEQDYSVIFVYLVIELLSYNVSDESLDMQTNKGSSQWSKLVEVGRSWSKLVDVSWSMLVDVKSKVGHIIVSELHTLCIYCI